MIMMMKMKGNNIKRTHLAVVVVVAVVVEESDNDDDDAFNDTAELSV